MIGQTIRFAGHLGLTGPDKPLLAHLGRSIDPVDQIDALADQGFAGVQDLFLKLRPTAQQAAMAHRMAVHGLALTSFGGDPHHWNQPLWSASDPPSAATIDGSVVASCALAQRFGGASAVCVAGLDPDRSRKAQRSAMVENLKRHGDAAAGAGLTLLVEPIAPSRIPGLLIDRLEDGVALVEAVNMPSVRLLFDIAHVAMMDHDVVAALRACAPHIGLIQAADTPGRVDIGLGELNWPDIFDQIIVQGYDGVIELEHEPVDQSACGEAGLIDRLRHLSNAFLTPQRPVTTPFPVERSGH